MEVDIPVAIAIVGGGRAAAALNKTYSYNIIGIQCNWHAQTIIGIDPDVTVLPVINCDDE